MAADQMGDRETVERLGEAKGKILGELEKVIVGQKVIIEQLLIALLCGGHCLLVGVPGLAKTLLINTLAKALDLTFNRVQFTPDLMPSDITGTEDLGGGHVHGSQSLPVREGTDLCECGSGRRDQSNSAQNTGCAPPGHAGA